MTDLLILLQGALADRYQVERELGRGGMATVFLAHDLKHGRSVALKVLRPELAAVLGRERFLREITLTARLDHPHVLALLDSGEVRAAHPERSEGPSFLYYVMPYVEGESLRERLKRERQLPLDDVLRITRHVADALSYAHHHGVLHRDIKPENILLAGDYARVGDFGIARAVTAAGGDTLTQTGLALGTPVYMSPEQAAGDRALDGRTDIYSLGCVVYEMLAGQPPYTGATAEALLARKSLEAVPSLRVVRGSVPQHVEAAVTKALDKVPADRFGTASQFIEALERGSGAVEPVPPVRPGVVRARLSVAAAAAAIVMALLISGGIVLSRLRRASEPPRLEYAQLTSFADAATSPALSPDGRLLAFIRGQSTFYGPGQIYVKLLPDGEPVRLTDDSLDKMSPKFSPDGARITYTTYRGGIWDTWVVPALGGQAPRTFLKNAEGVTWLGAGAGQPRILFSETTGRDVQMAIITSTESRRDHRVVYLPPETGMAHRSYLSPDGRHILVIEMTYYSWLPCRLVPFDGSSSGKPVGPAPSQCTDAAWSPDGKWMYFTANTGSGFHIWRQRFPDGTPEQVTSGVTEEEGIAFAPDGRSFVTSVGTRQSTVWVHDSRGDRQLTSEGYGLLPTISPDGKKLYYMLRAAAVGSFVSGALWVADLESGQRQRLLPDFLMQYYDISPDGERVVFVAAGETERSPLWLAALDGGSAPRRLVDKDALQAFFGANGEVIFAAKEGATNAVYRVREDGSQLRRVVPASNIFSVSPDGQWVAAWVPPDGAVAYPVGGGSPVLICRTCVFDGTFESSPWPPPVSWSRDGQHLYLKFNRSTYAIPLRPGRALPAIPASGLSVEDVVALPGARPIADAGAFPGPDPSVYAFTKVATQRNVYRVPVP